MVFFDSSALVKAYLDEDGTGVVLGAMQRHPGSLFISRFVALEVLTTLRTAFRNARRTEWSDVLSEFRSDYEESFNVIEVGPQVVDRAVALAVGYRLARARSMDLVHLATALHLQATRPAQRVTLITSDRDLAEISNASGLRTFDPSREPLAALPPRRR